MAPGGSVSAWLRDLALAEARKRRAVVDLARLLDATKAGGDMTDEEAAGLRYELVWTPAIAVECRRILDLPRILKRLKGRETQARQVLARLAIIATMVPADLLGGVRVVESDPDDDVLFATALAAGARTIVSGDAAVLAVGSFAGVMVVSAAEVLATLGEA